MKKVISVVLCLCMMLSEFAALPLNVYAADNAFDFIPFAYGDVDGSDKVDIVDATFIQRYATEITTPFDKQIEAFGDVDDNGKADIVDATFVQRHATEINTPYQIGDPIQYK